MTLSFKVTRTERPLIVALAKRAAAMERDHAEPGEKLLSKTDWEMYFSATHASGNPLRLHDLLAADDFNFAHDAFGIVRHMNHETGALEDFFSPRFSARRSEAA